MKKIIKLEKLDKQIGMDVVLIKDGKIEKDATRIGDYSEEEPLFFVGIKIKELRI